MDRILQASRTQSLSQNLELFGASRFVIGDSICRQLIELAGFCVALDFLIEKASIKFLEPRPQLGEVRLGELSDCPFYVV